MSSPIRPPEALLRSLEPALAEIERRGGRAICVGGFVRDLLLDREPLDLDIEVQGLDATELEGLLAGTGRLEHSEPGFGVFDALGAQWGLPREEVETGPGHRELHVRLAPDLPFERSVQRRDFTCNAIGMDARTGLLLDPLGGIEDTFRGILRPIGQRRWQQDPLRALRGMQLLARLGFAAGPELLELAGEVQIGALSTTRVGAEWRKLLLRAPRPSRGLQFLADAGLLRHFPELAALRCCPQDALWHPEGDVWTHTLMVVDAAAALRTGDEQQDLRVLLGALCHDLGKPATTFEDEAGAIRSPAHEPEGEAPTRSFLERLGTAVADIEAVVALVRNHLAPVQFVSGPTPAGSRAYRRLARQLHEAGTDLHALVRVAHADSLGRTTADARARHFSWLGEFRRKVDELEAWAPPPPDLVQGRHLIARGFAPGPDFRPILDLCREIQDEGELTEAEAILDRALDDSQRRPPD